MMPRTELERSILCCFLDEEAAPKVAMECDPRWFASHRVAFEAAVKVSRAGHRVTSLEWAREWARASGRTWGECGAELVEILAASVGCRQNLGRYSDLLRELWVRSELVAAGIDLSDAAGDPTREPSLVQAASLIEQLLPRFGSREARSMVARLIGDLEHPYPHRFKLSTGLLGLDEMLDGGLPQGIVTLAARTSMGKSALAINIAMQCAMDGVPVRIASFEMSDESLLERAAAFLARTPVRGDDRDLEGIRGALATIYAMGDRLRFLDTSRSEWSVPWLIGELERTQPNGLVVIDYLTMMKAKGLSRYDQLGSILQGLRTIPARFQCPVLLCAQLNRQADQRSDHRPLLSDLRDSGNIEEASDIVMLLHRPSYYDPTLDGKLAELAIAKNREGRTGLVRLHWRPEITTFSDPT